MESSLTNGYWVGRKPPVRALAALNWQLRSPCYDTPVRTILHISDLHFPRVAPGICDALLELARTARPTLCVISGDLTQRGRESQYRLATDFLHQLPTPWLVVPGNHDVPLFDVYRRLFRPTERFTRLICPDLCPLFADDELLVVGANSTRALTGDWRGFWKNGTLSDPQLDQIRRQFASRPAQYKVLVVHHPLVNPWDNTARDCARGRNRILAILQDCGVNAVLSGHLHLAYARLAPSISTQRPPLCINAGTTTSTRLRDEPNSLNLITFNAGQIQVQVHRWNGAQFQPPSPA